MVESAKKINTDNKDINLGLNLCKIIYSVMQEINLIDSDTEFRH